MQSTSSVHLNYLGVAALDGLRLAAVSGLATSGCDGHRGQMDSPVFDFGIKGSGVLQTEQRPVGALANCCKQRREAALET